MVYNIIKVCNLKEKNMKLISLVGARPQFIKEAVINWQLKDSGIEEILVHSGQHYDLNMSDIFFKTLNIKEPDYHLNVGSGTHAKMTAKIMIGFEEIMLREKPDLVVVYGDTNTTLAGAIVSAKLKIPVTHIEAGVRMEPKTMPEEINRVLTDRISSLLFTSSKLCVENLNRENITSGVYFVGDTMYDLYLKMEELFNADKLMNDYDLKDNEFVVVTIHRDYNTDDDAIFKKIIESLNLLAENIKVVFPMHPRTKKRIDFLNLKTNFQIMDPIGYLELQGLVRKSKYIVTDSGGLQKESYFAKKRAVVLMPDTGWRELIENEWNLLSSSDDLLENCDKMEEEIDYPGNLYGDGNSAEKIVKKIKEFL
jgi:UDP-N-acetylglucosamine 2-epimerase (non-hydrolysing)